MIWILLVGVLVLLVSSYFLFKKDLFSPSVIVCSVYLISILCALYNFEKWELVDYHMPATILILVSLTLFVGVSYITKEIYEKKSKDKQEKKKKKENKLYVKWQDFYQKYSQKNKLIHLPKSVFIALLVFFTIVLLWNLWEVYRISHLFGEPSSLPKMMEIYRQKVSYSILKGAQKPSVILNQLAKIMTVVTYVISYIVIRNIYNKDKLKNNWAYILLIVMYLVYSLMTGGRLPILKLLAAVSFLWFVFASRRVNWKENLNKKILKVGGILLVVLLVGFYATKEIVGRSRKFDPIYYVTMYTGGSIKLLDMYMEKPIKKSPIFGKETFYSLNTFLGRFGLSKTNYIKHLEFRYVKGEFLGNVYTPLRRYYHDFGYVGCFTLVSIFSFVMTLLYSMLKKRVLRRKDYQKDSWLVLYAFIVYSLFLYSINDEFYAVFLSVNYFTLFLFLRIAYLFLVELDLNKLISKGIQKLEKRFPFLKKKEGESSSFKSNLMRVFSANFIYTITSILIGFVIPAILTLEGYASLKTYTLYMTYAGVLHFGFVDGIYLKYGGKDEEEINKSKIKGEHLFLSLLQILMTALLLLVAFLRQDMVFFLMAISVLPANLVSFHKQYYQAVGNFKKYSLIMNIYTIAYALFNLTLVFLVQCKSYEFYCLTNFICNISVLIMSEIFFFKKVRGVKAEYNKKELKQITKSGFFLMIGNLAAIFLYAIDKWFVKLFFETKDFSYYSFAVSMFNIIIVFLNSISITFYNIFAKEEKEEQVKIIKRNLIIIGSLASTSYFVLALIVSFFLKKYIPSLSIIAYSFATFPYLFVIKAIFVNLYKSRKKEKRYTKVVMMMLIIASLLNTLAMVIYKSTDTIAMATLLSFIIWFVFSFVDFKYLKPTINELFYLAIITPCFIILSHFTSIYLGAIIYLGIILASMILVLKVNPLKLVKDFLK